MITRILVPDLGATGGEVRLVEWLAREGAFVNAGQPLFTLETDKAVQDVEAFSSGFLRKLLVTADSAVELGAVVALLAETLEEPLDVAPEPEVTDGSLPRPRHGREGRGEGEPASRPNSSGSTPAVLHTRKLASPAARKLAQEHGIDLADINGSGSAGEIHLRDVQKLVGGAAGRRVPLSAARLAIARVTQQSKSQIPHFHVRVTIDMTEVLAFREQVKSSASSEPVPSVNDVLLFAAAKALRQTPDLNARFEETSIFYFDEVNIGMAIGLPTGVVIPVILRVDQLDLAQLSATTRTLRQKAESGTLSVAEMSGGALTLTNLGAQGVDSFDAIINPPQAAVLAVGAATPQPAMYQGQLAIRTLMQATLSVDHRIADGAVAAQFLREFKQKLESSESCKPKKQRIRLA